LSSNTENFRQNRNVIIYLLNIWKLVLKAVCKCREYGGDVATPYDQTQDQYMFDFIETIFAERFNFSNPKFCEGGEANKNTAECPFGSEGLTKLNWGQMIIWIGYNYDDNAQKWQMVNGTDLDLLYHYFGLVGSGGNDGRKRRSLDEVNVNDDNEVTITIDNSHIVGQLFEKSPFWKCEILLNASRMTSFFRRVQICFSMAIFTSFESIRMYKFLFL